MFIRSFRLHNLLFGLAALLLAAAIAGNLAAIGVRALGRPEETETSVPQPEPGEKVVWLTFDDGPSAVTGEILDVLKETGTPATFFVIGSATERGQAMYKRILEEGHSLGIHSFSHRYDKIYASADAYLEDFEQLSDHLHSVVGVRPDIFRFPGGSNNRHASQEVLREIRRRMEKKGRVWFDWNAVAKDDGAKAAPADKMFQNIVASAGEKERILILMHDDALRKTAPECVRKVIEHYRALGYRFERLTAETDPVQFG